MNITGWYRRLASFNFWTRSVLDMLMARLKEITGLIFVGKICRLTKVEEFEMLLIVLSPDS